MNNAASTSSVGRTEACEHSEPETSWHNVGEDERAFSCLAGVGLMLYGLRRGSWAGAASFLTGISLLHRGWSGYCVTYDRLGISTASDHQQQPGVRAQCLEAEEADPEDRAVERENA